MILLFIGPPGSGKGTQAKFISKQLNLVHFSTGEVFRHMKDPQIEKFMDRGDLVPDEKVIEVFQKYIEGKRLYDNLLIDGSPRSLYQYNKFKQIFSNHKKSIDKVIYINISDREALKRLTSRRIDKKTGKIYNLITNPPGPNFNLKNLSVRDDDTEEAVLERLRTQKVPEDMLEAIKKDNLLIEVNGERPINEISQDILEKLKKIK